MPPRREPTQRVPCRSVSCSCLSGLLDHAFDATRICTSVEQHPWISGPSLFGIVPSENAKVEELRDWKVDDGEIRADPRIAREILEFIEECRVLSVAMTDGIIGCPHQQGIDYEGEWCPLCEFWHG